MPLGWQRLNEKKVSPNKNIVFIKPLKGPDEAIARDFLERIAAQCAPIMNRHYLAVASLEEYEPNNSFVGRNFNHGEVIQLVLKSKGTGRWLPFKFVQMVMMHELAHNKEMNHHKAFWKYRNEYCSDLKDLWQRDYTGDGMWGKGVLLENGLFAGDALAEGEVLPEHLCGGTLKSRGGKKRKAKPKITYKEQKERRILKKFGANGMALGADEEAKVKLEKGKKPAGKPRVAGSMRGRELRAAAALARFEVKEEEPEIKDEGLVTDSEAESEDEVQIKTEPNDAVDIDGTPLLDSNGRGMVRVCDDEGEDDDVNVKNELRELQSMRSVPRSGSPAKGASHAHTKVATSSISSQPPKITKTPDPPQEPRGPKPSIANGANGNVPKSDLRKENVPPAATKKTQVEPTEPSCPVCTVVNDSAALTCMACANVLKPRFVPNSWKCTSAPCEGDEYINAGDVGVCGVCGTRKRS
ncbi:DNA-dependent metalloprotease WSS1-like protein [Lachnellula suecica]|uniref:DNA-dependent metalloprotease WSS1-like protein n=1 Tax=Lachnellula suecica TaxID=602035 RepID=A0A8T9BZX3_9HELO|nr:DNA-dependent metalloprotease WSS1-like protein [Lachnellula suecica]